MNKQFDWLEDAFEILTYEPSTGHCNIRFYVCEVWNASV